MTSTTTSTADPLKSNPTRVKPKMLEAIVGLGIADGLGAKTAHRLMLHANSPVDIWQADESWFKAIPNEVLSPTMAAKAYEAIRKAKHDEVAPRCVDTLKEKGLHVLVSPRYGWEGVSAYPERLSYIENPPWILFAAGNTKALTGKTLSVVGTRRMSDYGRRVVQHVLDGLAQARPTIVSGLAEGVDGAAHADALRRGLPTVAVFGCGIDKVYPAMHRSLAQQILDADGVWVSEYPPGMPGNRGTFPQRNRIIVGLSFGVLVVEGHAKSGSMITARLAIEEDRAVFAPPGNLFSPGSEGPHTLIKQGAVAVTDAQDILNELQWGVVEGASAVLSAEASAQLGLSLDGGGASADVDPLLACIGYDPTPLDVVRQRSGLSITDLQTRLTLLELTGQIAQLPGQQCRRV